MPSSSSTFSTPMCAMPRANPPPNASPSVGRRDNPDNRLHSCEKACTERTIRPKLPKTELLTAQDRPRGPYFFMDPTASRHDAAIYSAWEVPSAAHFVKPS